MENLYAESKRLSFLVSEFLGSQTTSGAQLEYIKKQCDLSKIVHRAIDTARLSHPNHVFVLRKLVKEKELLIEADFDKLLQVFINICNNAIKFSPLHSRITVTINIRDKSWSISIKDQGIGIASDEIDQIFQRFYKGKHNSKEGMGLGLYLSKNIIEAHNGTILVKSVPHKGTRFMISLPKLML